MLYAHLKSRIRLIFNQSYSLEHAYQWLRRRLFEATHYDHCLTSATTLWSLWCVLEENQQRLHFSHFNFQYFFSWNNNLLSIKAMRNPPKLLSLIHWYMESSYNRPLFGLNCQESLWKILFRKIQTMAKSNITVYYYALPETSSRW